MNYFTTIIIILLTMSCGAANEEFSEKHFNILMTNVAEGWSTQNTTLALSSFHEDAIYMEPPNVQYFRGHKELRPYFDELDGKYKMEFHNLWFNKSTQSGAGEFTFSYGTDTSDVGIAVVELQNEKIKFWREYHRKGPTNFEEFIQTDNKDWDWHIGNYPAPKDTSIKN